MLEERDIEKLLNELPPIIRRRDVGKYLGGMVSPKTLSNLATQGKGPRTIRIGRNCGYITEELLRCLQNWRS